MDSSDRLVIFFLGGQKMALPLAVVERIVRAVEVTPVPEASETLLGLIDLGGNVVPLLDIRPLLGTASREIDISDYFVISRSPTRRVALLAESLGDVIEYAKADVRSAETIFPGLEHVLGVVRHEGDVVLIYNIDRLLTPAMEQSLSGRRKG